MENELDMSHKHGVAAKLTALCSPNDIFLVPFLQHLRAIFSVNLPVEETQIVIRLLIALRLAQSIEDSRETVRRQEVRYS